MQWQPQASAPSTTAALLVSHRPGDELGTFGGLFTNYRVDLEHVIISLSILPASFLA